MGIYVFYADVFLLQNFLMDYIAVTGANLFLKRRKSCVRLLITAAISSAAGLILLLCIPNYLVYLLISHFLLNTLMVFFCFGRCGGKEFLENWAVTYLAVIVLGGIFEWLAGSGLMHGHFFLQLAAAAAAGYGILLYLMQRKEFGNHIFPVRLVKDSRGIELKAYWDSGNQLRDPYTGQGVSIISHAKALEFLDMTKDRIRYVPYRSLGEENGLLKVTNVDELLLIRGNKTIRMEKIAIGIADEGLLEEKEYDLILHASLL